MKRGVLSTVEGSRLAFECPGCRGPHIVRTGQGPGPRWGWNGSYDKPTFTPSILVRGTERLTDEEYDVYKLNGVLPTPRPLVCHSYVTDGKIKFLDDCTHSLAGQTVELIGEDE